MRLLVTRPEHNAARFADALGAAGHEPVLEPLLAIEWLDRDLPDLDKFGGVVITSTNGLRALRQLTERRDLPLWAVGEVSGSLAEAVGFETVRIAEGDVDKLADLIRDEYKPQAGPLLHAGGDTLGGDLGALLAGHGFEVVKVALYRAEPRASFSPATLDQLKSGVIDGVTLFSPRTADPKAS